MSPLESALIGYALVGCLYCAWILCGTLRLVRGVPVLGAESPGQPERWPRLSVIVPACNEAENLDAAARTLLAQDYPDLELILIDDRSTDDTGEIVDRLAGADTRVRAVHVVVLHRWTGFPLLPALVFPLAAPVGALLLLRAGWLGMWRGGVLWRGTLYPGKALRRGSRLPFP